MPKCSCHTFLTGWRAPRRERGTSGYRSAAGKEENPAVPPPFTLGHLFNSFLTYCYEAVTSYILFFFSLNPSFECFWENNSMRQERPGYAVVTVACKSQWPNTTKVYLSPPQGPLGVTSRQQFGSLGCFLLCSVPPPPPTRCSQSQHRKRRPGGRRL